MTVKWPPYSTLLCKLWTLKQPSFPKLVPPFKSLDTHEKIQSFTFPLSRKGTLRTCCINAGRQLSNSHQTLICCQGNSSWSKQIQGQETARVKTAYKWVPPSLSLSRSLRLSLPATSEEIENLLKGRSGSKSCCGRLPAKLLESCTWQTKERKNVPSAPRSVNIRTRA